MVLEKLTDLKKLVLGKPVKKLALAPAQDMQSLGAVLQAGAENIIEPILLGNKELIEKLVAKNKFTLKGVKVINEKDPLKAVDLAVQLANRGEADILMKGNVGTSDLLKSILNKEWGLRTGNLLSHFALFEVGNYHKLIALTDVAMNISPDLKDKIAIINNSVKCLNTLGLEEPKIAVLGAVEMVNESMQATLDAALLSKMNQRGQIKNCIIDGPLAFDNAISLESANHKGIRSEVAGETDLLLMPDIEVGNVLYKSMVFFAKSKVASVILGALVPVVLTSRSDSEQAKFDSILLAAAASQ